MTDFLVINDIGIDLYGYQGFKWVRASNLQDYIHDSYVYAHVPNNFTLQEVTQCKILTDTYHGDIHPSFELHWTGGENIVVDKYRNYLPFGDAKLFPIIDEIKETANELGLTVELDDYSAESIINLMKAMKERVIKIKEVLGEEIITNESS